MKNRIIRKVYAIVTVAGLCLTVGSCGSDDAVPVSSPDVPARPDALCAIVPQSIHIRAEEAPHSPLTRSAMGEPKQKATYTANLGHNYSAEATLEAAPQEAETRAATSMATNAQYRIVVFDNTNAIVGNVVYKAGSTDVVSGEAIKLPAGKYRLFCYSFNTADAIKSLNMDNKSVAVNNGEDFMTYTVDDFTVSVNDYAAGKSLAISFVRQCAKLALTVKAEEYTNNTITAATATLTNVFGATQWDGTTNTDVSTLVSTTGGVALAKGTTNGASVDCGSQSKAYTLVAPFTSQTLKLTNISVTITGNGTKTVASFQFPNTVTLAKGGSYKLTLNIGNYYALATTNPVTIGGTKWARTNLYQKTGSLDVAFTDHPWDDGSYWTWGIRDATKRGGETSGFLTGENAQWTAASGENQDPCKALGESWRLPTKNEIDALITNSLAQGAKVKINGVVRTMNATGWAINGAAIVFISNNQVLSIPAVGSFDEKKQFDGKGTFGAYWSSGNAENSMFATFAYGLAFDESNGVMNIPMLRGYGASVRCVQD